MNTATTQASSTLTFAGVFALAIEALEAFGSEQVEDLKAMWYEAEDRVVLCRTREHVQVEEYFPGRYSIRYASENLGERHHRIGGGRSETQTARNRAHLDNARCAVTPERTNRAPVG